MGRILLVDDRTEQRHAFAQILLRDQHDLGQASSPEEVSRQLAANQYDAVIIAQLDRRPILIGVTKNSDPTISIVVLVTAGTDVGSYVRAGSGDMIFASFEPEWLRAAARQACDHTRLRRESLLRPHLDVLERSSAAFSGQSRAVQDTKRKIAMLANGRASVLITGEIGTGKKSAAHAIHRASPRAQKPFFVVNCAVERARLESELFGSEETNAPTGSRRGLLEAAHEGTVFLADVSAMPHSAQGRLLRLLTHGILLRVDSTQSRLVDVRILAGTRYDLEPLAHSNRFHIDLLHSLSMASLPVPPLRERRDDIPALCRMLAEQISANLRLPLKQISRDATEKLQTHHFPGNLRELRSVIEYAFLRSGQTRISASDLPFFGEGRQQVPSNPDGLAAVATSSDPSPDSFDLAAVLERTEKDLILRTLNSAGWVQAEAARRMGIARSVLAYKLNKYKLRLDLHNPSPGS